MRFIPLEGFRDLNYALHFGQEFIPKELMKELDSKTGDGKWRLVLEKSTCNNEPNNPGSKHVVFVLQSMENSFLDFTKKVIYGIPVKT